MSNLQNTTIAHLLQLTGDEDCETDSTFVFSNEGHTLGNALRSIIAR